MSTIKYVTLAVMLFNAGLYLSIRGFHLFNTDPYIAVLYILFGFTALCFFVPIICFRLLWKHIKKQK